MNYRNRKGNLLGPSISESALKPLLKSAIIVSSLAVLVGAAHAQANAYSTSSIDYSFQYDAGLSTDPSSDLTVTDNGTEVYNLISPFPTPAYFAPYASTTGSGSSASTYQDPTNGYDSASMSGREYVGSNASLSGMTGTAAASVGSQENLVITDTGTGSITLDLYGQSFVSGGTMSSGGMSATETGYGGIYAYLYGGGVLVEDYIEQTSLDNMAPTTSVNGDWNPFFDGYSITDTVTIQAGQTIGLEFYASGVAQAVPTPTGAMTLGFGLVGLGLMRRKRSR